MAGFNYKINYKGSSKVIQRIVDRLNHLADTMLGITHDTAFYGDLGKTAYDHSQLTSGNPHHVTAEDLGLGNVVARLDAIMYAIGMIRNWITHEDETIVDHDGNLIVFHGVGDATDDKNYLLYH